MNNEVIGWTIIGLFVAIVYFGGKSARLGSIGVFVALILAYSAGLGG